jgi:hypothetical protein
MLRDAHECSVLVEALREAHGTDAGEAALNKVAALVAATNEEAEMKVDGAEGMRYHRVAYIYSI